MHPKHTALLGFLARLSGSQAGGMFNSWDDVRSALSKDYSKICRCDNGVGILGSSLYGDRVYCSTQKCDTCDEGYEKIDGRCYNQQMKNIKEDYQKIKFDLTILIEESQSSRSNYEGLIDFAENIASYVDFAGGSTVTLDQYAIESENFGLNIGSKDKLEQALESLKMHYWIKPSSYPNYALRKITRRYKKTAQPNKKQVLIHLTEKGASNQSDFDINKIAARLKRAGVTTYVVFSESSNRDRLRKFVSDQEENLFLTNGWENLDSFVEPVAQKIFQDLQE